MNIKEKYISDKCHEIDSLLRQARIWAEGDPKLAAHLATYANVIMLGMLEDCIEYMVRKRAQKSGDPEIEHYISNHVSNSFRNPSYSKICEVLGQFSSEYKSEFQSRIKHDSSAVEALNSILENKTNSAHLGLSNLNLSIDDANGYFLRVIPIIEVLEDLLIINP
ncbi:hypothetical protein ACFLVN_04295 [Chloroflexota bacterium]